MPLGSSDGDRAGLRWDWSADSLLQLSLTVLFGGLIVAAFAYEAVEAAATLGWIAYPVVFGTGLVSFVLARVAYRVTAETLTANARRQQLDAEADGLHD